MPDHSTEQLQRWLQAVVTDPQGVAHGVGSDAARRQIELQAGELEQVVTRSRHLTAKERLEIYANSYYLRLLDCLSHSFPVVEQALGEELFRDFAISYLQRFPSQSYTLHRLGENLATFLAEARPEREGWSDFLIDLVRLEWAIGEVFDGPGVEDKPLLTAQQVASISPSAWPQARLRTVVCLRLLAFDYPVSPFYTRVRRGESPPIPPPAPSFLALTRKNYVVRRFPLNRAQHDLLSVLQQGGTVAEAIAAAGQASDQSEDQLAGSIRAWFEAWSRDGFFAAIEA
jgi:hypothetical protein